jgi:hypothetical protein
MSHDPLLDKFREVRGLLTTFRDTLKEQKRFTDATAALFGDEDRKFWALQEAHDRRKHAGVPPELRDALTAVLTSKIERWSRLCELARNGSQVETELTGV